MKDAPELSFVDPSTEMVLNVGGQIFETSAGILTKEPFSTLAAFCRKEPVIPAEPTSGVYFIERDWWLFRHILTYLRSNILPNEFETLKELYVEAGFYRLEGLQKAIENLPIHEVKNLSAQITGTNVNTLPGDASSGERNAGNQNIFSSMVHN